MRLAAAALTSANAEGIACMLAWEYTQDNNVIDLLLAYNFIMK